MELETDSCLYQDALAATKLADQRLEERTRADYMGSLRRFVDFCNEQGFPNPLEQRFVELPSVIAAYINRLAESNQSQWPAEKLRAALSWHYSKPAMLGGGHPHDQWVVQSGPHGARVCFGNPAKSPMISQILVGLSKVKKRARTPARASPMSLPKLTKLIDYLGECEQFNATMRLWMSAVCSLCFYGMCRINEVLLMKYADIQLGLERESTKSKAQFVKYGCFTIRDRKTDHDPHASRTYYLHHLPRNERAAEALTHVSRWFEHANTVHHHNWRREEYAFPSLTKIPRGAIKRRRQSGAYDVANDVYDKVGVKWGSPMTESNFSQVLNVVAAACGINEDILGDSVWFTSHCFRRGGAQYRFMFAPERSRWSLKLVKWWAGWSKNEQSETIVRYLLDDVLDREESQLGDSLAPDMIDRVNEMVREEGTPEPSIERLDHSTLLDEIKQHVKDSVYDAPRTLVPIPAMSVATASPPERTPVSVIDTTKLTSELPDAKSWRDYVLQYWTSNPAVHQYRAGVDMLPHERKAHRSRLSRMRTIAEFIRERYNDDADSFELDMRQVIAGELTVNKVLREIRSRSSSDN